MRRFCFAAIAISVALAALVLGSSAESVSIRGDYVEVRTASVFGAVSSSPTTS